MKTIKFTSGIFYTNSFLIISNCNNAILVDAPPSSFELIDEYLINNKINLDKIILTHGHWDHISDTYKFKNKYNCTVYIQKSDANYLRDKKTHEFMFLPITINEMEPDFELIDDEEIITDDIELKIFSTPGHTKGGISIYSEKSKELFTGDTLFHLGIGRTDFPDGSLNELLNSIMNIILFLPDDTIIYAGHGENSSILFEKTHNSYLR